ncbi:MAG: hypothetical protein ACD_57C00033G0002 [uncultured bacterium]|nr:MAG: hypothetical protein ACD_57C00033G0002 [uncultured bacterium]
MTPATTKSSNLPVNALRPILTGAFSTSLTAHPESTPAFWAIMARGFSRASRTISTPIRSSDLSATASLSSTFIARTRATPPPTT